MKSNRPLTKEEFSQQELERKKAVITTKLNKVKNLRKTSEELDIKFEEALKLYKTAQGIADKARQTYLQSEPYKTYLEAKAKADELDENVNKLDEKASNASEALEIAEQEAEDAEKALEEFMANYEIVNNPISWSEIVREQLSESRLNQIQIRQEVKKWSWLSIAFAVSAMGLLVLTVIVFLSNPNEFGVPIISSLVTILTGAISRWSFLQFNDAKKRFDNSHQRVENLQRELLGLSLPEPTNISNGSLLKSDVNSV